MRNSYPIIISDTGTHKLVFVPDFEINTQGDDITDAIRMARDAIGLVGIDMQDEGKDLPLPSELSSIRKTAAENEIVTLVDIDFDEYRKMNDNRTVHKNCTLPAWLCFEAEKAGLNFSRVLHDALIHELQSQ